jgi:uncharacterized protein (UPF0332 family)
MSFDWADFLTFADVLLREPNSPGPGEASLRSAISRAYYAAFCSARNFARDREGLMPHRTPRDHQRIMAHFQMAPDRTRRKIGIDLSRLRDNRNRADYDDVLVGEPISLAQSSIDIARNVLNALNSL